MLGAEASPIIARCEEGKTVTHAHNPWLGAAETKPLTPVAPPVLPRVTGPEAPQRGIPAPQLEDQLPIHNQEVAAPLWWLGTHGGSGESTLASLVPEWLGAGHGWPNLAGSTPAHVVLTARSNTRGLRAAQAAATQWAAGLVPNVTLLGLVILADSPRRPPPALRQLAQLVSGGVPRTWNVGWVESWRMDPAPTATGAPSDVRRLIDDLNTLLRHGAAGTRPRKGNR